MADWIGRKMPEGRMIKGQQKQNVFNGFTFNLCSCGFTCARSHAWMAHVFAELSGWAPLLVCQ